MKEIVYLYDGSFNGFLSVAFICFKRKIVPKKICDEKKYEYSLFEESEYINTNLNNAERVNKGIKKISEYSLHKIYMAFNSDNNNRENIILDFIINLFRFGDKVNYMRNIDSVLEIEKISRNVSREAHRFKGFVRFEKLENNIFYSKIEPDNNIIEILSNHFKARLKNEIWIIHDIKRNIASFYNRKEYLMLDTTNADFNKLIKSQSENEYEKLWKSFYESVNIKERKNLRCQMNFMPKKYWKNITEMENRL